MRVATVDGLLTLFYDGSKELWNQGHCLEKVNVWNRLENKELTEEETMKQLSPECKEYVKERWSWEQVIVEVGVKVIPQRTFLECKNVKRVIFADTVTIIKEYAFLRCEKLAYIKLSVHLELIEEYAFGYCNLSSVFVPLSCREIQRWTFTNNKNLSILHIPQDTQLGLNCTSGTELAQFAPFELDSGTWIKNINADDTYALHRVCFRPINLSKK